MSFLQLDALHVFVTGAAGGIGSAIVDEFLGKQPPLRSRGLSRITCKDRTNRFAQRKAAKSLLMIFDK